MDKTNKAFGCLMIFLLMLLSYRYLQGEISAIAANATLTNSIYNLLNGVFGILWISIAVFFLFLAFYIGLSDM